MRVSKLDSLYVTCLLLCIAQYSNQSEVDNKMVIDNDGGVDIYIDKGNGVKSVFVTSESQCQTLADIGVNVDANFVYKVQMHLMNSTCSTNPGKFGFNCTIKFYQKDIFALIGAQLCIDLQGIPKTLPDTQLSFTIFNQFQQLREIYMTSRLVPEYAPYYICSGESKSSLSVSLSVRPSVKMCPVIMDTMMDKNISFGSIMMRSVLPTYNLSMENSSSDATAKENAYIVKVTSKGYSSYCSLQNLKNNSRLHTNSCIELIYVSPDYRCNISVELSQALQSVIRFNVPLGSPFSRSRLASICKSYSNTDNDELYDSVLIIQKNNRANCIGSFAIRATFTDDDSTDYTDETYVDSMRQIYIAVFVSLISACFIILCTIFIFCLRLRLKRRTQRQGQESVSSPHLRSETSQVNLSHQEVLWSPSNPNEVVGLPTYDEIFGTNLDDVSQVSTKDQKPPAYDSLFSSTV